MKILLAFAPWIAFWVLDGMVTFELSVLIALAVALVMAGLEAARGRRPKALDAATLVWFGALAVAGAALHQPALGTWADAFSNLFLAVVAAATIVSGRPFTRAYADEGTPVEQRSEPLYLRATAVIAWAWVAAFVVMFGAALVGIAEPSWSTWTAWVVPIAALVLAMKFTAWYPESLQRRASGRPAAALWAHR